MQEQPPVALSEAISERTPRPLMGQVLSFNLPQELAALRGEVQYAKGHNARTLIKHSEFRIVLVALRAGASMHEQRADERIALQPVAGHVRLRLPSEVVNLHPDQLISLDRELAFSVEAVEDSALLLWVGWSRG